MKVKNGSCIRHLSFKTLMAARKRNIIAVLAIALTALLFTSLFTIVMSINETNQNYQFRSVGGYAHGAFKDVDEDQIAVLSAHPDVKAVGVRTVLGLATQGAFEKDYAEVSYMDDNNAKWSFSQPTVGRTPKSGNEITMDTKALELLGVKPELGAQVKVTYTLADKEQMGWDVTDTFTLVGWWDYDELLSVHFLNVSKEYAQKIEKKAVAGGLKPFRTDLSVMLRSSLNIENDLTRIGEDCGYSIGEEAGQLRIGVNWGYTATQVWDTLGVGGILAMLAVLILVAFTGYLVIYNIFQISVAGDIRYYGLLKTIGVTPKQLRRLIRQQALLLSALGIPVGLLLGYGVGAAVVPITMSTSTMGGRYTTVSVSPWIFLFSSVFALLTVLLSCARPGRIAGRVSPVEAVRYTERQSSGKTHRKGSKVTPVQMAAANLGRDKKKTALVMVSLSLTVVLLNLLVTFIGGFDMDKYLSRRSCADFLISTPDYFNYRGFSLTKEAVEPVRANTAHSLEGFAYQTGGVGMYLPESVWRDEAAFYSRDTDMDIDALLAQTPRDGDKVQAASQIEGLDPTLGEKLTVIDGSLDSLWEPDSHAIAIAVNLDDSGKLPDPGIYPAVGEKIKVTYGNGDTAYDVNYTVCALVDVPYNMSSRFYTMGYEAILSADALYRDAGEDNVFPIGLPLRHPQSRGGGRRGKLPCPAHFRPRQSPDVRKQGDPPGIFSGVPDDLCDSGRAAVRHHRHCGYSEFLQRHDDRHSGAEPGIRGFAVGGHDRPSAGNHASLGGAAVHPWFRPDRGASVRRGEPAGGAASGKRLLVLQLSLHHHPGTGHAARLHRAWLCHPGGHVPSDGEAEHRRAAEKSGYVTMETAGSRSASRCFFEFFCIIVCFT